jgi:hypothetical protein
VLLDPDAGERRDLGAPHLAPEQHHPPHRAAVRSLAPAHLGREWKITSDTEADHAVHDRLPTEDYIGASNVAPVVTASAVIYAQDRGGRVREMKFQWQQQGYPLGRHLDHGPASLRHLHALVDDVHAKRRTSIVWVTRSDGTLLGLTYVQEHEVAAWHHHDTQGTFECACATPEGAEDVLYASQRTINGRTVRYVERKRTRQLRLARRCVLRRLRADLQRARRPRTISGLWHLEGMTVSILADGAVQPQQVVTNGTITLAARAASTREHRPALRRDFETLPLSIEGEMAAAQGMNKNVNAVWLRLNSSSGVFAGPSTSKLTEMKQRTTEPYGTPPALMSGVFKIVLSLVELQRDALRAAIESAAGDGALAGARTAEGG